MTRALLTACALAVLLLFVVSRAERIAVGFHTSNLLRLSDYSGVDLLASEVDES